MKDFIETNVKDFFAPVDINLSFSDVLCDTQAN